jgi:exonuclease III
MVQTFHVFANIRDIGNFISKASSLKGRFRVLSVVDDNVLYHSLFGFARLLGQGWTDALRKCHPEGPLWTFWNYKFERWPADKGMRLDHFLLSTEMSERLVSAGVDRWVRGEINASDHAPVWINLDV